jgi:dihydrodipicolinate synthase/N-acetylneuraminate lyase
MTRKQFVQSTVGTVGLAVMANAAGKRTSQGGDDVYDIYPVPPVAWSNNSKRTLNTAENEKIFRFLTGQGAKRIVYGGNALVYHMTLPQYSEIVEWLSGLTGDAEIIPAVGPSYGRALDHAAVVRGRHFHSLLVLPSTSDPLDAKGLETGLREVSEAAGLPLSLYIKNETNFGLDKDAGLDVVARLVDAKVCSGIKYAVVRKDPADDPYLRALLTRVDASRVISGIGERPAIVHLRDFKLTGFTTGSGVLAPTLCRNLLNACRAGNYEKAEEIRQAFLPLEDLRDAWGPPKVLHYAVAAANIASTGPILPYLSPLQTAQLTKVEPVAKTLHAENAKAAAPVT